MARAHMNCKDDAMIRNSRESTYHHCSYRKEVERDRCSIVVLVFVDDSVETIVVALMVESSSFCEVDTSVLVSQEESYLSKRIFLRHR